jgi:cytochrome P450
VLRHNPLEAWSQQHFEQPIVTMRTVVGRVALISDPSAIRRVLLDNTDNYRKDPLQRSVLSAGLNEGLLAAEVEQWRRQRRALAPIFSRKSVIGFAPVMIDAANELLERWRVRSGEIVDVAAEATRVAIRVLEQTIFSDGLGRDPDEVRRAMAVYFTTLGRIDPLDLFGLPDFIPRPTRIRVRPTLRYFDAAMDEIIARRKRLLAEGAAPLAPDILTLLLQANDPETGIGMSEAEVRGNILTFIAAGQETTANAITWSLFLLSQSPDWRERVADEARRVLCGPPTQLYDQLNETRAVVEEAIRLYPPISAMSRISLGPDELAGQAIGPGTLVVIAPYVLHRHRRLWQQPDVFDPNRFLGEARSNISRFAYLPFGIGPRTCIGQAFALQEATLVVASVIRDFSLEVAAGHQVWPVLQVTLRPRNGMPMIVRQKPRVRSLAS